MDKYNVIKASMYVVIYEILKEMMKTRSFSKMINHKKRQILS